VSWRYDCGGLTTMRRALVTAAIVPIVLGICALLSLI
jgi:hypothetical protein